MVSISTWVTIGLVGAAVLFRKQIGSALGNTFSSILGGIGGGIGQGLGSVPGNFITGLVQGAGGLGHTASGQPTVSPLGQPGPWDVLLPWLQRLGVTGAGTANAESSNSNAVINAGDPSTSNGQELTVTPHTREQSDVTAMAVQAGRIQVQAFKNILSNQPPTINRQQAIQIAASKSGGQTPFQIFQATRYYLEHQNGLSVQDAFHAARGVLQR